MTKMIDSVNIASTNNAKNLAPKSFLTAYGDKSVKLRIMKDAINMYQNSFLEREKILEEEKQKLEELNYEVWSLEDSLCEQVWRFSHEHDFFAIFHPFVVKCAKKNNNYMKRNSELIDLMNEIDAIKAEIINLKEKDVTQEVENALTKLRKLQLISDDITELLKVMRPSESMNKLETISMPIYDEVMPNNEHKVKRRKNNDLGRAHTKLMKTNKSDFTPKKKLIFTTPTNYPQLSLERSIILTTNTLTSNEKLKNFTLKKRSEISMKFQKYREHKQ